LPASSALFISEEALNLARSFAPNELFEIIRERVSLLFPTKYQRRWARRLRTHFGFEREDAYQVALATFGRNFADTILGVDVFVTYDSRLIERFNTHKEAIEQRFTLMTCHLMSPYRDALLPKLFHPQNILSRFVVYQQGN
jgi:hypothetical protein